MISAEAAAALFTICNTARVLAYLPQIIKVARDEHGAAAISYTTWALFAFSHASTILYAVLSLGDVMVAAVFGANTGACLVIIGLTLVQRRRYRLRARGVPGQAYDPPMDVANPCDAISPTQKLTPATPTESKRATANPTTHPLLH